MLERRVGPHARVLASGPRPAGLKTLAPPARRCLAASLLVDLVLAAAPPCARRPLLLFTACRTLPLSRLRCGLPLDRGIVVVPLDAPAVEIAREKLWSRAPRTAALPAVCALTSRRPPPRARPSSRGRGEVRLGPGRAGCCLALACCLAACRLVQRARLGDELLHRRVDRCQLLWLGQQPRRCVRHL